MTITDFLLARIYEDEAIASRAPGDREWEADPSQANPEIGQVVSNDGAVASGVLRDDAHHIARWDPARVLAECAAKRRIVAQWQQAERLSENLIWERQEWVVRESALRPMLHFLALPYADHPDYDPTWSA